MIKHYSLNFGLNLTKPKNLHTIHRIWVGPLTNTHYFGYMISGLREHLETEVLQVCLQVANLKDDLKGSTTIITYHLKSLALDLTHLQKLAHEVRIVSH